MYGAVAFQPFFEGDEVIGVLAAGLRLRGRTRWGGREQGVFRALGHGLTLALQRAGAVRALAEEREALAAVARFTDLAADTGDVDTLARQAADVFHTVLGISGALYTEREGDGWRVRHPSGPVLSPSAAEPGAALPARTPSL
ncbi:hypothetical protein V3W47_18410 [Deinococcus sp. YIM 134068]|uniref:hypothetical protein n=1 Tax=Deinococcus lichenicola TaxID=3118910 RepID=UPI002F926DAE